MSQSSVPRTAAAVDPFLFSIEQETYTQAQLDAVFAQDANDQAVFTPALHNDLNDFKFVPDNGSHSYGNSSDPSTASTPDFSSYSFDQQSSFHPPTPHSYAVRKQQTPSIFTHPNFQHRPLAFRTQTSSSFVLPSQPPQGYDRRRSLSHSDVDRIAAAAPPHPTFVRLQGLQDPRVTSSTTVEHRRSGYPSHGRSVSQGPMIVGRPLQNTVPYSLPGSPLVVLPAAIGTPIGTPFEVSHDERCSRKRTRHFGHDHQSEFQDPELYLYRMTDPIQLRHSRRIIEIGAMGVRNHKKIDPKLDNNDGLYPHKRIMKKLDDVERHLKQDEADNQDALNGCAMIREALHRRVCRERAVGKVEDDDAAAQSDSLEVPSKMMSAGGSGLDSYCLGDDNLMGLLMKENERLGDGHYEA